MASIAHSAGFTVLACLCVSCAICRQGAGVLHQEAAEEEVRWQVLSSSDRIYTLLDATLTAVFSLCIATVVTNAG